jgi:hypothetical protein
MKIIYKIIEIYLLLLYIIGALIPIGISIYRNNYTFLLLLLFTIPTCFLLYMAYLSMKE